MNLTYNDIKVMSALIGSELYGIEIIQRVKSESNTKLFLGSLYNVLSRLEKNGLVKSRWGDDTEERKGARKRYYKLTGLGEKTVREEIRSLNAIANYNLGLGFA